MKGFGSFAVLGCAAAAVVTVAWSGHELPVYPSYYPHEIEIKALAPAQAPEALRAGTVQAYVGAPLHFSGTPPAEVRALESLGSFVVVRANPYSPRTADETAACAAVKAAVRALAEQSDFIAHPYPVTPFHGDYLHHADLAAAAQARFSTGDADARDLKIKGSGSLARIHPDWSAPAALASEASGQRGDPKVRAPDTRPQPGSSARDTDWDLEVIEVDAGGLVAAQMLSVNGWLAPPWVRTGWFHAERLLADAISDADQRRRIESARTRLEAGAFGGLVERINLERNLVTALTGSCWKIVAGYTVKREYVNVDYSAGIENIGYDSIAGLASPIFIRTVKLKDFPWNGWLTLGTGGAPAAAWNPIGGMNDPFGRLMGFAVGDPALLPSPYESGWMLNRIADVASNPER
jgi:hypothetical protein